MLPHTLPCWVTRAERSSAQPVPENTSTSLEEVFYGFLAPLSSGRGCGSGGSPGRAVLGPGILMEVSSVQCVVRRLPGRLGPTVAAGQHLPLFRARGLDGFNSGNEVAPHFRGAQVTHTWWLKIRAGPARSKSGKVPIP